MSSKRYIVIVEPSPFRTSETFIRGPYGKIKAWFVAYVEAFHHPYSVVYVRDQNCKVYLGEKMIWPPNKSYVCRDCAAWVYDN